MDLIIKPTEKCNFKCTFCSSTKITEDKTAELDHQHIFDFLKRFPETNTIIVNGGDPLMMSPEYYQVILDHLDENDYRASVSFTTNLYPFYKNPTKWMNIFSHKRVGVTTSFQYGGGRLKGDLTEYTEEDFWEVSNKFLIYFGYRPDFISVITKENEHDAIKNVELAKKMNVVCKLNYAMSSGPPVMFKGIRMGQEGNPYLLADIYEIYIEIWKRGLAPWEFNTTQMMKRLKGYATCCPQNRECDGGIRTLQPSGDYYSCGAFGDDRQYPIDFQAEMSGATIRPLKHEFELQTMTDNCYGCPMFEICNGCKKTIKDHKDYGLTEVHCTKMKGLAGEIIKSNE
jgi:radical SAM protein with 4Fe4S-binding SPASM domain